jgi:subtilisin family serine protease
MAALTYYSDGKPIRFSIVPQARAMATARRPQVTTRMAAVPTTLQANAALFDDLFETVPARETETMVVLQKDPAVTMVATETLTVEGATRAELKVIKDQFGMEVVREGLFGKVLLRIKDGGGPDAVKRVFECATTVYERGKVDAAHPNFVRLVDHTVRQPTPAAALAPAAAVPWWNHQNAGTPGVRGADAAVRAAWTIHRGDPAVRVAVLDEGVDVNHPDLKAAVVAQKDFAEGNPTAMPSGNDAHGTACAGIIVGRGTTYPGITACSLVAVRIAKGDGHGHWIFDDFATADAIDWAWKDGAADVLSNSWGGGPPVDAITNAFERARTKGRGGKGSVIAVAAGNAHGPIQYPATLREVLCVGASNEWDEQKTPTSHDGETWWGSCFGQEMSLVAPGVHIATTDIAGAAGYTSGNYILTFNGTSAATPHVAAAAALVLSVVPKLKEQEVRAILTGEAAKLTAAGKLDPKKKWNKEMGWGRLDIHAALRQALHP